MGRQCLCGVTGSATGGIGRLGPRRAGRPRLRCVTQLFVTSVEWFSVSGCPLAKEIRIVIRKMLEANVGWGSPGIVGQLRKLGIDLAKSTVGMYRVRSKKPPSPTWKTFLKNHPPALGKLVECPEVGELHHHYEGLAA